MEGGSSTDVGSALMVGVAAGAGGGGMRDASALAGEEPDSVLTEGEAVTNT